MQVPSILQGESRTRLLQGVVIGAAATMAIGFSWGGWMTSRTANTLAAEHAQNAVVAALTPICVAKFLQEPDSKANLAALQKISSNWQQGDYLEKGGWATRPGATSQTANLAGRAQRNYFKAQLNEMQSTTSTAANPGAP
jgi:poly(3-hydroxybutyrate) depolymerase